MNSEGFILCCSSCGSGRIGEIQPRPALVYLRCKDCGHCTLLEDSVDPSSSFELSQKRYFGTDSLLLRGEIGPEEKEVLEVRKKLLLRLLPRQSSVVEVGPGAGHVLQLLKEHGFSATAVEHSSALAEGISAKCGMPVVVGEWETADLPNESFDAFCSFHVIEHVKDPVAHLAKAFQVVRSGGLAFVATPNARSLQHLVVESLSPNFDSAHRILFSRRSLINCCQKVGWQVVESVTPEISSSWARVLTKALRRVRGEDEEATAGRYSGSGGSLNVIYRVFQLVTGPVRFVQRISGLGNEVFLVLRKP